MTDNETNNIEKNLVPLSELRPGEKCRVVKIKGKGAVFARIVDMGIHPGMEIFVERVAPLGDPVEFKMKGCHLSLRRDESMNILVERID